jgi:hypothetical protein
LARLSSSSAAPGSTTSPTSRYASRATAWS